MEMDIGLHQGVPLGPEGPFATSLSLRLTCPRCKELGLLGSRSAWRQQGVQWPLGTFQRHTCADSGRPGLVLVQMGRHRIFWSTRRRHERPLPVGLCCNNDEAQAGADRHLGDGRCNPLLNHTGCLFDFGDCGVGLPPEAERILGALDQGEPAAVDIAPSALQPLVFCG